MTEPCVDLELSLRRGSFELSAALRVDTPCVTSIFGASGAGKSSLLRAVAGLERAARGHVRVGGATWQDAGSFVPPERRAVGVVFQHDALFRHLDVLGNLRFGERRVPSGERRVAFDEVVDWLDLAPLLDRRPATLSGGERQRVAVGRALLASPRLFLLDEPLSALDAPARARIVPRVAALPRRFGVPVLHVSHDLSEVARVATRVLWLDGGRVRAEGAAAELLPRVGAETDDDALAAVLVGRVRAQHGADGLTEVEVDGEPCFVRSVEATPGDEVRLSVLARDVSLGFVREVRTSILNQLPTTVAELHESEAGVVVALRTAGGAPLYARVTRRSARALALAPGMALFARVKGIGVVGTTG